MVTSHSDPAPPASGQRRLVLRLVAATVATTVASVGSEVVLRAVHYYPWQSRPEPNRPTFNEPDPVLGWRNKAGRFVLPPYSPGESEVHTTNWTGGRRATGPADFRDRPTLALIGCSYTQGFALSDHETYPWKLQQAFPSVKVENYAAVGYSTYQALLSLENLLTREQRPAMVIYGLLDLHEVRNVATSRWRRSLLGFPARGHVDVPYCTLDREGRLQRHKPERYHALPFREQIRTFGLLDEYFNRLSDPARESQKREVTEKLLIEMQQLCARRGVEFAVAMLSAETEEARSHYTEFCLTNGMTFVDTCYKKTKDLKVAGDSHPNDKATTIIATNIIHALGDRVRSLK
jgi:hypothetical protein